MSDGTRAAGTRSPRPLLTYLQERSVTFLPFSPKMFPESIPQAETHLMVDSYLACQQVSGDVGPDIPVVQLEP